MTGQRPHVFVIVGDCLRAASATAETMPYVSRTADVSLEPCYAPSTWTFPSFATLYAGETPIEHGATRRGEVLERSRADLPRRARANGYVTALFSENPTFSQTYGFHHGMDLVDDSINFKPFVSSFSAENYVHEITPENVWTVTKELLKRPGRLRNLANTAYGAATFVGPDSSTAFPHHGDRVFDHLGSVARSRADEPLFCVANLLEPHDPHHAPPAEGAAALDVDVTPAEREALWAARDTKEYLLRRNPSLPEGARSHFDSWEAVFERTEDVYRAQVRQFDLLFERWYEALPPAVREDALVLVTGDHGQLFGEEGMVHHQTSLHPRAIEVPLFAFLPDDWTVEGSPAAAGSAGGATSWLGLSRALAGVCDGQIRSGDAFLDALRSASASDDGVVVTADGPTWNTSVLEEAEPAYDPELVDRLKVRRVGLIDGDEQLVLESGWEEESVAARRYRLDAGSRRLVERDPDVDVDDRYRRWLLEPARNDAIDARASARLKQLGYV